MTIISTVRNGIAVTLIILSIFLPVTSVAYSTPVTPAVAIKSKVKSQPSETINPVYDAVAFTENIYSTCNKKLFGALKKEIKKLPDQRSQWAQKILEYSHLFLVLRTESHNNKFFLDTSNLKAVGNWNLQLEGFNSLKQFSRAVFDTEVWFHRENHKSQWKIFALNINNPKYEKKALPTFVKSNVALNLPEYLGFPDRGGRPLDPQEGNLNVIDYNNDGLLDIFVSGNDGQFLYENRGLTFEEVARKRGINSPYPVKSALFVDFDNDGDKDLVLGICSKEPGAENLFYEYRDGKYIDRSADSGLNTLGHSSHFCAADINNDGLIDLFAGHYLDESPLPNNYIDASNGGRNLLFLNEGNLHFKEVSKSWGMDEKRWTLSAVFFDINRDGFQDLYIANDFGPNRLYINQQGKSFSEKSAEFGLGDTNNGMSISLWDNDRDGDLDILISGMYSFAGGRIVGQIKSKDPEVLEKLWDSRLGNSFYRNNYPAMNYTRLRDNGLSFGYWAYGGSPVDMGNCSRSAFYLAAGFISNINAGGKPDL